MRAFCLFLFDAWYNIIARQDKIILFIIIETMNKQIRFGIILQYAQMALSILISLLYTPLMLNILGKGEYGLYNLASSVISYLSLLSLGFGSSYLRFYFKRKKENPDSIKSLNGLYLLVFLVFGVVSVVCGLVLSGNISIFFNSSYSSNDIKIAKVLMVILTINISLSFPMSVFISFITSQEKFIFQKLINIGKTVLSPALSIIALFLGFGSIGLVIATTIINIIVDIINVYYCLFKLKMKISFRKLEFGLLKEIFVFSIFIAINQIIDKINWETDKIVIGKIINKEAVSSYSVGSLFNSYYLQFSLAISAVFAPQVNKIVQSDEKNKNAILTGLMTSVGRIQFFVLMLVLTGFVFFGKYFISAWAGQEYSDSYIVALLLMAPATIPLIQNIGIEIQRAKNKHKFRSIVYLAMALLNVCISVFLTKQFGIIGAASGTTITLVIANGLTMNIYYRYALGLDILKFWKEIVKILPSLLLPVFFGIMLFTNGINSLSIFIKDIIIYITIYVISIICFGLNKKERMFLLKWLKIY